MTELKYIEINKIYPHPDNPREELGDLTELADSIKVNGILQNLTVVPLEGGVYRALIGHRRLAASALVGLETVPCVVKKMSEQEQIRTMAMENMHRKDLNYYEQSKVVQMMLDLGDSVADIAENTGLSQTTIRNRMKLAKLDPDRFKKTINRQASLEDYMKLDEIEDEALRNEVLDTIGTENFRAVLKRALEKEKTKRFVADRIADVEDWATEITEINYDKMRYLRGYNTWNWHNNTVIERPEDADTVNYYYKVSQNGIDVYADKVEKEETEEDRKRRIAEEADKRRKGELEAITNRHFELRQEFIDGFGKSKKYIKQIAGFVAEQLIGDDKYCYDGADTNTMAELLGIECDENTDLPTFKAMAVQMAQEKPEYVLLVAAYTRVDSEDQKYWWTRWNSDTRRYEVVHQANEDLDKLYDFLISLGYEISDEEKAMRDGTHELFRVEDNAESDPCVSCKAAHPGCDRCCSACDNHCNAGQDCHKT